MTADVNQLKADVELKIPDSLAEDTRESMRRVLEPIFGEAGDLCVKAREIVVTDVNDKEGMAKARELRLAIKKVRTSAEHKRKELKEDALRTGQAIDSIFKQFKDALGLHEDYLDEQERYAQIIEAKRINDLADERVVLIKNAGGDPAVFDRTTLGTMDEQAFETTLVGVRAQVREAAERAEREKAEAEERRKAEEAERAKIRAENERLRAEKAKADAENARLKQEAAEREARDEALKGGTDAEKLLKFVQDLGRLSIPICRSKCGKEIAEQASLTINRMRNNITISANNMTKGAKP